MCCALMNMPGASADLWRLMRELVTRIAAGIILIANRAVVGSVWRVAFAIVVAFVATVMYG